MYILMLARSGGVRCISLWPKPENREATPHVAATVSKAHEKHQVKHGETVDGRNPKQPPGMSKTL